MYGGIIEQKVNADALIRLIQIHKNYFKYGIERDDAGYDEEGFDEEGYDRDGFDGNGLDRNFCNRRGEYLYDR